MQVSVTQLTGEDLLRRACEATLPPGKSSRATIASMAACEHSPLRVVMFWVELRGIPSFVSTHLVRHKYGVEHFVQSLRDDRGGPDHAGRTTPVNHAMLINAQALLSISRARLCYQTHRQTRQAWRSVREAMRDVCPDLIHHMVPKCVHLGRCTEPKPCKAGPETVLKAWNQPCGA